MDGGDMEQCDIWDMLAIATHEQLAWTVGPLAEAMKWLQTGVTTNTTRVKKTSPKSPSSRTLRKREAQAIRLALESLHSNGAERNTRKDRPGRRPGAASRRPRP